jgi:hypothetical protein
LWRDSVKGTTELNRTGLPRGHVSDVGKTKGFALEGFEHEYDPQDAPGQAYHNPNQEHNEGPKMGHEKNIDSENHDSHNGQEDGLKTMEADKAVPLIRLDEEENDCRKKEICQSADYLLGATH